MRILFLLLFLVLIIPFLISFYEGYYGISFKEKEKKLIYFCLLVMSLLLLFRLFRVLFIFGIPLIALVFLSLYYIKKNK